MHYIASISEVLLSPPARPKVTRTLPPLQSLRVVGAWRNWWTMQVEEPPSITARQTRSIGARGRMVPRH